MENIDFKHVNDDLPRYGENFDYGGQKSDWCVYVHINKINGKKYIGISHSLKTRWSSNGSQYKDCKKFYNAIKKHGWDNFEHIVLMNGLTAEMAGEIEKELIQKYQTRLKNNGYNDAIGGIIYQSLNRRPHSRKIHQYDINGIYIQSFDSVIEAAFLVSGTKNSSGIINSLTVNHYAYGFLWNDKLVDRMEPYRGSIHVRVQAFPEIVRVSIQDFSTRQYKSIYDVSNDRIYKNMVLECCGQGKRKRISCDGYFWFFITDYNEDNVKRRYKEYLKYHKGAVIQYDLEGNFVAKYASSKEAAKTGKFIDGRIIKVCNGEQDIHNGFQWRFENDPPPQPYTGHSKLCKCYAAIDTKSHKVAAILYGKPQVDKFLNHKKSYILRALKNPKSIAHGYYWRRVDNNGNIIWFDNDFLKEE